MLILYQFPISHYCEKVRWALEHKGLEYKKINLLPGLHTKKTKKLTSKYTLPILQHGNTVLGESSEIISYLDSAFPEKTLTPANTDAQIESKKWESFADSKIGADVRSLCYYTLLDHPDIITPFFTQGGPWYGKLYMKLSYPKLSQTMKKLMQLNEIEMQKITTRLGKNIEKLNAYMSDKECFVGNQFGRADIANAALLAPLIKAPGYGIDWPVQFPEPLQSTINNFGAQLDWVHRLYEQYR